MLSEVEDATRLTSAVLLRRQQTFQFMGQVRSIVEAAKQAIEESRKLLAVNEALLAAIRPAQTAPVTLTDLQLDELAVLISKSRGGHAFVWNAHRPLPIFDSKQSSAIQ